MLEKHPKVKFLSRRSGGMILRSRDGTEPLSGWWPQSGLDMATGESAQMRGFATGVGSKADIGAGAGPPRRARGKGSTLLPRRSPKYYIVRFLPYSLRL